MTYDERRRIIQDYRRRIAQLNSELDILVRECPHDIESSSRHGLDGLAICSICLIDFGWFCPTSLNLYCVYNTPDSDAYDASLPWGVCVYCQKSEER